jgi:tight adherence protein B
MIELIIYVILGIAVLLAAEAIYHMVRYSGERQRVELRKRMRALVETGSASLLRERRIARNRALARFLIQFPYVERLEGLLIQTELDWTVATMVGLAIILSISVTGLLLFVTRGNWLLAPVGIPLGCGIPILLVLRARTRRGRKISEQMADALDMMSRSLQAGHGVSAALKMIATELPPPIAIEFGRCFEEHNLGADFREAITNMTRRVPGNLDLRLFAVSLVIQTETGGNLVEILDKISNTIRERYKFYGKLRALTAEGKASGIVLGSLPLLCALAIVFISPGYLNPLIEDPLGRKILMSGVLTWGSGIFWLNAMSRVDI